MRRIDRNEDARVLEDAVDPQCRDRDKPHDHHRPERPADARRSERLEREQRNENRDRSRDDVRVDRGRRDFQPLERREHRDGRRDGAVAVDQGRAEQAHGNDGRPPFALDAQQRHQGEDAALAVVVDAHRDRHVFDRGDDDERPDHERQCPERDARVGVLAGQREHGFERVERARADVAEDDPEGRERRERKGRGGGCARAVIRFRQACPR